MRVIRRIVLVALSVAALAACMRDVTQHPASLPGTYAIATRSYSWTDPSRWTPANGSAPAHHSRVLPVDIVYPDDPHGRQRFPVVVFVHGVMSDRRQSPYLLDTLASHGFIAVAADFPLTANSTPGGATDAHAQDEARDIAFLVDRLGAKQSAGEPWASTVDPSRYVVVGHSTGGAVAIVAAFAPDYHDPRVAGVISLSGDACFFSHRFLTTRRVPAIFVGATNDRFVPVANHAQWAYDASASPHALVIIHGGDHVYFTKYCIPDWLIKMFVHVDEVNLIKTMARYEPGTDCTVPAPHDEHGLSCPAQHAITDQVVLAFADRVLRGDDRGVANLATQPALTVREQR